MKNTVKMLSLTAMVVLASCSTKKIFIDVTAPAPVSLSSEMKKVGIINRTEVSGQTKNKDNIEKTLSLESAEVEKEGISAAITALKDELQKNGRFTEVSILENIKLNTTGAGVFPAPLSWDEVQKICNENNVDVLYSLELYDTDNKVDVAIHPSNLESPEGVLSMAVNQTAVNIVIKTGWRIYDPVNKLILDEIPINQVIPSGPGIKNVTHGLVSRKDDVKITSTEIGQEYGLRILPYNINVLRKYFIRGNDNFRTTMRKARIGKWDEAAEIWKKEISNTSRRIAGRACFNMAVFNEIKGDIDTSIQYAQKSYEDYKIRKGLKYYNMLIYRKDKQNKLKSQQE